MAVMTTALIRLYPRRWRQRYGQEMRELLAAQKLSFRTVADLVAGAIDARLNPKRIPAVDAGQKTGVEQMVRAFRCAPEGVSLTDQWRSAAWMVGGSLVLTLVGLGLKVQIGSNSFSEGLMYAAFPASLMLSSECTYFKRYSPAARGVMSVGGAILIVVMMWGSVALANRI